MDMEEVITLLISTETDITTRIIMVTVIITTMLITIILTEEDILTIQVD